MTRHPSFGVRGSRSARPPRRGAAAVNGVIFCALVIVGAVVATSAYLVRDRGGPPGNVTVAAAGEAGGAARKPAPTPEMPEIIEGLTGVKRLDAPQAYEPTIDGKDKIVEIELSEYAGYAGLIAANGGMDPNDNSVFAKKHGFKVKFTLSEEESWGRLNAGKMAASATTVDVLAVYGKQFGVVVPAQIGYSRGADGIIVRKDVNKINALKGKVISTAQFTESDFFIRYLAQEAGLPVNMMPNLQAQPDPDKLNLVFCADGAAAAEVFKRDVKAGSSALAGCVTWEPKTTETADALKDKAHVLTTNRNLLIVADVLVVNKGFAQAHPEMVAGLVDGLLEGNRMVRDKPQESYILVGNAFGWDVPKTRAELAKVHLSNLPENLAFFSGAIDAAGSFESIYNSAVLSYGDLVKNPPDAEKFVNTKPLKDLEKAGAFAEQKIAIAPIRTGRAENVEGDPLLSKNIRFLFKPNSASLDLDNAENLKNLEAIKQLLVVSPGSRILLRGHVDNARIGDFRREGGEQRVREMALSALDLSKRRASEIKRLLIQRNGVADERLDTVGRGWEEPVGTNSEQNRRVEAQWFTLE